MEKYKIKMWKNIPKFLKFEDHANECARKDDYMNLYIFDTFEEMYDKVDKEEKQKIARDYMGRCYSFTQKQVYVDDETGEEEFIKWLPCCGNLYFVRECTYVDVVPHECSHAVVGYFNRKIKNHEKLFMKNLEELDSESNDLEELFCYMHGNIVSQVCECISKLEDK